MAAKGIFVCRELSPNYAIIIKRENFSSNTSTNSRIVQI